MATEHYVDPTHLGIMVASHQDLPLDEDLQCKLTNYVKQQLKGIKHGDTIALQTDDQRDRNSCVYIWDQISDKVMSLSLHPDDYGTVPPQFQVTDTEFRPDYWTEVIGHNGYFWPSQSIRDRAIVSRCHGRSPYAKGLDTDIWYSHFNIGAQVCHLVFEADEAGEELFVQTLKAHQQPWCCQASIALGWQSEEDENMAVADNVMLLMVEPVRAVYYMYRTDGLMPTHIGIV